MPKLPIIGLDIGERRIGVAVADGQVRLAVPLTTLTVDGSEVARLRQLIADRGVGTLVVGYPRNQSGQPTAQTAAVEAFVGRLGEGVPPVVYQDESLTSVLAEQRLVAQKIAYTKADIDAQAATIILQDYLETHA